MIECKEGEGRQADFCRKEASSPVLESMDIFTNGPILTEI